MHPLKQLIIKRQQGEAVGIASYCTANNLALDALMEHGLATDEYVLIEATANQVNQFGGYTGMLPKDFADIVYKKAEQMGLSAEHIILGGDHLGPLVWSADTAEVAMEKSRELVRLFVLAEYTKIHLDTSMKLADDPVDEALSPDVVAERGVELYKVCIEAFEELKTEKAEALRPVFIIGSEVPIPGGMQSHGDSDTEEEELEVTKVTDFERTLEAYDLAFHKAGVPEAWNDVIAVVVQPGVEFGDDSIFHYDSENASDLCARLKDFPNLVFEGHSTDYQTFESLTQMVEDGIAILKVGPALTFGLREALFSLSKIEAELIPAESCAHYIEVLEAMMLENPGNWQKHYQGTEAELAFKRKYSFSDRARYYMGLDAVVNAQQKLFENLSRVRIPLNILHQYMPFQYEQVVRGELELDPVALAKNGVIQFVQDYSVAIEG